MGLFGITLKKLEAIPGDIVGGVENLFGGGNSVGGSSGASDGYASGAPTVYGGGSSQSPVYGPQAGPSVGGQPRPGLNFLTTPPPGQRPLAPGQKRDKYGNIIPANGGPQNANSDPVGQFVKNAIVKPVTNTIAGDIVEPARSLTASFTGNQAAESAADQRGYQDVQNSAPVLIGKGLVNFGKAAANVPQAVAGEVTNNPVATQHAAQAGLKALNQSFEGPFVTAPEDVIAHNIKGAAQDAQQAGFDTKQSVGSAVVKSGVGLAGLAYPDAGILSGLKGALTGADSAMAEGAAAADSARLPEPTTTEADVQRVMRQTHPTSEPAKGGEPLPTPPPETASKIPQKASQAELDSLYNSAPQGEATPQEGASVNPEGTKLPPPNPNPQTYEPTPAREADYEQPFINQSVFHHQVDKATAAVHDALDLLSDADRANFVHYAQGTLPIAKADHPNLVQAAVTAWKNLSDLGHAAGEATAPGATAYKQNYFPGYYLDKKTGEIKTSGADNFADASDTKGFRSQRAKFENRQQALNAGEKPAFEDPSQDIQRYANGLKHTVGSNLVKKGLQEADRGAEGEGSLNNTLNDNTDINISKEGEDALKKAGKLKENLLTGRAALRKVNRGITKALISTGAPHLLIIPRRAWGAAAALKIGTAAAKLSKGLDDTAELPKLDNEELGIRIGSPIHSRDVNAGVKSTTDTSTLVRKLNPFTATKRLVFDHMLPTIHNWLIGQAKEYMDAKGIDYNSPEARAVGRQINAIMGYDRSQGLLSESLFAPALVKSTIKMYGDSFRPGYGIARGGALGEQLTNQMAGFVSKSISNHIMAEQNKKLPGDKQHQLNNDTFLESLARNTIDGGAIHTPFHNSRGEQIDLRPTGEYQADVLRDFISMKRNAHGGTNFGIDSPRQIVANALQTGRNVAAPLPGDVYSLGKNKMFNNQNVYNPYSPLPEQVAQGVTSFASSSLPINAAGFVNKGVESHLPGFLQSSVELNKSVPDNLRAAGSTFGLNAVGDATTGQGPELTRWFGGQDAGHQYIAAKSQNISEQNRNEGLFDSYFTKAKDNQGRTIERNQQDQQGLDDQLAANPTVMKAVQLAYKKQGKGNYEPFWDLNEGDLNTFLSYRALAPGEPDKDVMIQKNPWISDVGKADSNWAQQQQFSGNITHEDGYVPYPNISDAGKAAQDAAGKILNIPADQRTKDQKAQLNQILNSPDYQQAEQLLHTYNNQVRTNQNLGQINYLPNVPTQVSDWLNKYMSADSATRKGMKASNPGMYSSMQQALENQSLYDVEKQGSIGYLGGTPSESLLSGAYSLGQYDIAKGKDANGNNTYSLENFSQGSAGGPPPVASYGNQEGVQTTNTPIASGFGGGKSGKSYASSSKASAALSRVIASEKVSSQARDAEHAAKADKNLIKGVQREARLRSPKRLSIHMRGETSVHPFKVKGATLKARQINKVAAKPVKALNRGNRATLKA